MKPVVLFAVLAFGIVAAGCFSESANGQKSAPPVQNAPVAQGRRPVLVELFTSEGCSSCPPADRALKFLAEQQPVQGAEIVPLAFHVDYWDNQGWKDQFSSAAYTKRQELYVEQFGLDSSYTPEMVVDGESQFIGSDTGKAVKEIGKALERQKSLVTLSTNGNKVDISVKDLPQHSNATLFLAIVEKYATSAVERGENAGSTLQHAAIVRELKPAGLVGSDQPSATFSLDVDVDPTLKPDNIRLVAFVQENNSRRIIAVSSSL